MPVIVLMGMDTQDNTEMLLQAEHKTPVEATFFKPVCMEPYS